MPITYLIPVALTLAASAGAGVVPAEGAASCDELRGRERALCRIEVKLDRVPTCSITETRTGIENMYCTFKNQIDREPAPDSSRRTEMRLKEMEMRMRGRIPQVERQNKNEQNYVRGQIHRAASIRKQFVNARTNRRIGKQEFPGRFRPVDKEEARKSLRRFPRATTDLSKISGPRRVRSRVERVNRSNRDRKNDAERLIRLYQERKKKVPPIR